MKISDPRRVRYLSLCRRFGKHVQNLTLDLSVSSQGPREQPPAGDLVFSGVLGYCLNLRKLAIEYNDSDITLHHLLAVALSGFTRLETLHILGSKDFAYSDFYHHYSPIVHHNLLSTALDHYSSHLRSLSLRSLIPLHPLTFRRVRDTVTHLREIDFTRCIGVELRSALAEPQRWACADHLQHIRLVRCEGVHAAIFANQLAAGIFGHPRTVRLAICGDFADLENLPFAPKWVVPRLELLELDHFAPWEMKYLGQIHAEIVRMDRTWQWGYEVLVTALKNTAMFPGVQALEVADSWEEEHFDGLKEACLSRGIKAVELVRFDRYD